MATAMKIVIEYTATVMFLRCMLSDLLVRHFHNGQPHRVFL